MTNKKPSDIMKLYKAIQEYVESRGGKVLVIGGVETIKWPDDREFNYTLGIRITGIKPETQPEEK